MPQISSIGDFKAYKYQDLRIYSSTEWLADNRKMYRQVFEESKVKYIYVDLSLINKLYDRETWDLNLTLKCYKYKKGKNEVCSLEIKRQVSKNDHIIHIREGWGHKRQGSFWKKGKYSWEASIDGEILATKYFHIEDISSAEINKPESAIKVTGIDYYEGNYDQIDSTEDKNYYVQFEAKETKYVFVELTFDNRLTTKDWFAEIFIRFYNDSRDLKGEVVRLEHLKQGENKKVINAGWGSNTKGTWREGIYDIEIIFQNKFIASSYFEVGKTFIEGFNTVKYPDHIAKLDNDFEVDQNNSKNVLKELNALIGLNRIKKQIHDHTKYIKFLKLRKARGFDEPAGMILHSVFTGNPGTGKTTIARKLGSIYHKIGVLSKGHVHEVSRVDLVGEYIGQTAPKVRDAIDKARGGVLFIDEAYSLARSNDDSKDFGREVIELLIKEMSHPKCDFMVIAAGYPTEMENFILSNPGLSSRFKYFYNFTDYSCSELFEILDYFKMQFQIDLTESAKEYLSNVIQNDHRNRKKSFGNARYIAHLLEQAKIQMGIRLMHNPKKEWSDYDLKTITLQDVSGLKKKSKSAKANLTIDEVSLQKAMLRLDNLIGLHGIKSKIHDLVDIVRFKLEQGADVIGEFNMHTVLIGNPGTGKTTVTRICADIFKSLGVLERGHIVETDRQGLIAGFVGQTAIKTAKVIKDAQGGLLFIDEAYALHKSGAHNDFGDEAIQVLLKQMEDLRGEFFVFAAGYPKEMDSFLRMNPGLKSRFDLFLNFDDFVPSELMEIAEYFCQERKLKMSSDAKELLFNRLSYEYKTKDKQFGNARRVRVYFDEIIKQQNLRLASENRMTQTNYNILLKKADVQLAMDSVDKEFTYNRKTISF